MVWIRTASLLSRLLLRLERLSWGQLAAWVIACLKQARKLEHASKVSRVAQVMVVKFVLAIAVAWRYGAIALVFSALCACASRTPAPVEERGAWRPSAAVVEPTAYTVIHGDTLYSIAFRYGLDWRQLAQWNQILSPYLIHPGDRLRLSAVVSTGQSTQPGPSFDPPATTTAQSSTNEQQTDQRPHIGSRTKNAPIRSGTTKPTEAAVGSTSPGAQPNAGSTSTTTSKSTVSTRRPSSEARAPAPKAVKNTPPVSNQNNATKSAANSANVQWRWPVAGVVKRSFLPNDSTRQGIDLTGRAGDSVQAAADGTVVYSGTGLIGYGELIIIKHNDRLLSAYGHNRKRLVKEGDVVKSGQVISEMGQNSSGDALLHFEIRVEGKPQNPLTYLPKR